MSRRRQSSSSMRNCGSESENSLGSDNLHVSFSLSPWNFDRKFGRPLSSRRGNSVAKKTSHRVPLSAKSESKPRTAAPTSGIPEDAAVHFGNFYSLEEASRRVASRQDSGINKSEFPARTEFTGQMVHKLERLAGTEFYARQVSALLEKTVEAPNFTVKPAPVDNFVPYERSEPMGYPLWYKEPDKMMPSWTRKSEQPRATERTREMQHGECVTSSATSGSRRFVDVTDCEKNDESSSDSSNENSSDATAEEDSDCEQVKVGAVLEG